MRRPTNLDPTALAFYTRHSKRLIDQGLLTESTFDSFVLLCKTFSLLTSFDPVTEKNGMLRYISLSKMYQVYSRGFSMNSDRAKEAGTVEQRDEYGL